MSDCSSSSEDEDLPRLVSRMVVEGGVGDGQDIDDDNDDDEEDMEGEELYVDGAAQSGLCHEPRLGRQVGGRALPAARPGG